MALNVDQATKQIVTFVKGLTARQKITIGVGAAVVAATIWVFVALLDRAEYKPLYSGLSPADAQTLSRRLSDKNIPFELTSDGTGIMVPADQLDRTRLDLASEGMPTSGRLGFELFDKPNWAGSDFAEKVNYQRALEGELEQIKVPRHVASVAFAARGVQLEIRRSDLDPARSIWPRIVTSLAV